MNFMEKQFSPEIVKGVHDTENFKIDSEEQDLKFLFKQTIYLVKIFLYLAFG